MNHRVTFKKDLYYAIINGTKTMTRRFHDKWNVGDVLRVCEPLEKISSGDLSFFLKGTAYSFDGECLFDREWRWKKKSLPAIYMPDSFCRLRLLVTGKRKERLQDISAYDVRREGISVSYGFTEERLILVEAFKLLWDDIYRDKPGKAWGDNPEVTVYGFEKIEGRNND